MHALLPDDGEVAGLLALMLLTDARRAGAHRAGRRADPARRAGPHRCGIARRSPKASRSSRDALSSGAIGAYQLQAAIAAVHDEAARAEDTDWPQILALYGLLERMSDNPMVALNHAIAAAMVHGPAAGLELLTALDSDARLSGHYRLDAVRAHLLEMAGDRRPRSRSLSRRRRTDGEHSRAGLPDDQGGATRRATDGFLHDG